MSVVAFTETWLNNSINDEEIEIDGYKIVRRDRLSGSGGGVCFYIRNDISFNIIDVLSAGDSESLWINLLLPRSKPIIVGVIYRPPKSNRFIEKLSDILDTLKKDDEIILLGDINICLFQNSPLAKKYIDLLSLHGFSQLIKDATRVTPTCSSLLDHVVCNNENKISQSGIIDLGISDHSFTFCTRKNIRLAIGVHRTTDIRSLKNYNEVSFNLKLSAIDWSGLTNCTDVNKAWSIFQNIFISTLNIIAPQKRIRIKQRSEDWITKYILSLIRERNIVYKKMNKKLSDEDYAILSKRYRKLRNEVQREVKRAKLEYLQTKIEENKKDSKRLWQNLKSLGLKKKNGKDQEFVISIDGKLSHDKVTISNKFNSYFTNVAATLVDKLPTGKDIFSADSESIHELYEKKGVSQDKFELSPVSEQFIFNELRKLNVSKSTGLDMIPAKFLKEGAKILYKPLSYLINLSIFTSTFPEEMKIAKVTPLHKKKDKTVVENYRPISVLSIVSKILEKAVCVQIEKYFKENDIIYEYQSGFRHDYSTETCLIHLTDYLRTNISKGQFVGMVLLDLQKAFDTVNHGILLKKLQIMGFNQATLEWFRSYLSNRHQVVAIRDIRSKVMPITCGVPQGSILGPILFSTYINDMSICIKADCKLLLYADDSVLLCSNPNPKFVEEKLSEQLSTCVDWMTDNRLSLHLGKTESILFCSERNSKKSFEFGVTYNNQIIQRKESVKYLGIELASSVSFSSLVESVVKKANARLKFLYRYQSCMDVKARRILCFALIQCLYDYANPAWYSSINKSDQKKLKIIQNKMVRFINCSGPRTHVGYPELSEAGFLEVNQRSKQLILHHVHKIYHTRSNHYIGTNFNHVTNVHSYNTRNSRFNFNLPERVGCVGNSFYYNAIKHWNSLPNDIKGIENFVHFKRRLKEYLSIESQREDAKNMLYG